MNTFFMIWSPDGHAPTVRHYTKESARAEAERLALSHENTKFYILEAVACCNLYRPLTWRYKQKDGLDIPF